MSLVQDGLAKVYDLWSSQEPLLSLPPAETFDENYFYITPKGKEALTTFPKEWFPTWSEDPAIADAPGVT